MGFEILSANTPPKNEKIDIDKLAEVATNPTNIAESLISYESQPIAVNLDIKASSFIEFPIINNLKSFCCKRLNIGIIILI